MDLPGVLIPNSHYSLFRWLYPSDAEAVNHRHRLRRTGLQAVRMLPTGTSVDTLGEGFVSSIRAAFACEEQITGNLLLISRGQGSFLSMFGSIVQHSEVFLSTLMTAQGINPSNLPALYAFVERLSSVASAKSVKLEEVLFVLEHLLLPGTSVMQWIANDAGHSMLESVVLPLARQQYCPKRDLEMVSAYMLVYTTPQAGVLTPHSLPCTPPPLLGLVPLPWDPFMQRLVPCGGTVIQLLLCKCAAAESERELAVYQLESLLQDGW